MIEKEIHKDWGSIIEISPENFFEKPLDFWRDFIYQKKLVIFKKMKFDKIQYLKFCLRFGKPWSKEEYEYSNELAELLEINNSQFYISPFSNILSKRLVNHEMPWHADIPNRSYSPFPFRSLWITKNPRPKWSGHTSWLNLESGMQFLSKELRDLAERVTIVQQSWYDPGTDIKEVPLIKQHPITGNVSLRLNYYIEPNKEKTEDAWIIGVKIDNQLQKNCDLIKEYIDCLCQNQELLYTHVWDTFDIAIYDNWSFVHKRSQVLAGPTEERHFYRVNINHCIDNEWEDHKKELLTKI
jgi:alpha-ketoglutarate-dependent taurine dioxygenase